MKKLAALGIDYDVAEIAKNMGDDVMTAVAQAEPKTITNLTEADLSDDADESFDPEKLVIDSEDEFDDFEYDSDHTDDDDGIDVNIDNDKLENAIRVARAARNEVDAKSTKEPIKKGKRKEPVVEPEVSAKKAKTGKENKTVAEPKAAKKADKKSKQAEKAEDVEKPLSKKSAKKPVKAAVKVATEVEDEPAISEAASKKGKAAKKDLQVTIKKPIFTTKARGKKTEVAPVVVEVVKKGKKSAPFKDEIAIPATQEVEETKSAIVVKIAKNKKKVTAIENEEMEPTASVVVKVAKSNKKAAPISQPAQTNKKSQKVAKKTEPDDVTSAPPVKSKRLQKAISESIEPAAAQSKKAVEKKPKVVKAKAEKKVAAVKLGSPAKAVTSAKGKSAKGKKAKK